MNEYVALAISAVALILTAWQFAYQRNKDFSTKLTVLLEKVARLEVSADHSWRLIEMYAGTILHHPVTPQIDFYIDKNLNGGLSKQESIEFAIILQNIIHSNDADGRKAAATLMLAAIVRKYKLAVD